MHVFLDHYFRRMQNFQLDLKASLTKNAASRSQRLNADSNRAWLSNWQRSSFRPLRCVLFTFTFSFGLNFSRAKRASLIWPDPMHCRFLSATLNGHKWRPRMFARFDPMLFLKWVRDFHIKSHHITSHHITSHHITSHHITSLHFTSLHFTSLHFTSLQIKPCMMPLHLHFTTFKVKKCMFSG
jgi:hypothetical protein